jgi:uncharacterized protein YydD (DUF2326 family)
VIFDFAQNCVKSAIFNRIMVAEPAILAQEAIGKLEAAITELQGILQELGEEISL